MADEDQTKWPRVKPEELHSFTQRCLISTGMKEQYARDMADVVHAADYRGHYSHGLNRLEFYIEQATKGLVRISGEGPKILKETAATAWVDGNNVPGATIGKFCMELAIKKAKEVGVSWVTAKNTTHFGIAGLYSMMAAKEGLMGMAYTNTSPAVVPTRAKKPVLGTNALSVAAPGPDGDSFVLDMATSTVATGKVELAQRKGTMVPSGWGCDENGKETNDPTIMLEGGAMLPLGGMEETGGYKGYGLNLMVELFCTVLGGGTMSPFAPLSNAPGNLIDRSHCYVAINPDAFAPGFTDRSGHLMDTLRNLETVEEDKPVLVPGDPERIHMKLCDDLGGIPYHPNQIQCAKDIARQIGVEEMKTL